MSQYLAEVLDSGGRADVIYTDFSRAFDVIDHGVLIRKLGNSGCDLNLLRLLHSYLTDRSSSVFYNGYTSHTFVATSGVPQGSNLGPLLFNLFLNDLLETFTCPALAYADDLKLYTTIGDFEDVILLQDNIDSMVRWCEENKLMLNVTKCMCVTYTRGTVDALPPSYVLSGVDLPCSASVRDLGVLFDSHLSFVPHIDEVCARASRMLGFLLRTTREFHDNRVARTLYFAFVMPILEYASMIWSPHYVSHQLRVERVQRRYLKCLSYREDGVYPDRGCDYVSLLERHGVTSLSARRARGSVIFLRNLLRGRVDCAFLLSRVSLSVPRAGLRTRSMFYIPRMRTNVLRVAPVVAMCRYANMEQYADLIP